jgi:hypothetical protein
MGRFLVAAAAAGCVLLGSTASSAGVIATPISDDPYTNTTSQHRTQLEPDSFAFGNTIVTAFQTGRFFDGGASNIGWATSTDGGVHWTTGMLPGTTIFQGGPWARISDPAVAYDPLHNVWMVSGLAIDASVSGAAVTTSRSLDGGLTWLPPVNVAVAPGTFFDKNWIVCDTWASSPHYGNCYTEWDDAGVGGRLMMSTSTDGGATWGPIRMPAGNPSGIGGQPVVQPDGTVVVPYNSSNIRAFRSTDGGATWTAPVTVAADIEHNPAGGLRGGGLITAEVDGAGKVYVAWQDCRFRSGCPANDIVFTTSTDGLTWSAVSRIPIDATTSGVDHFIPGIGVDRSTSGNTAHVAVGYYYYPVSACNSNTCQLTAGFISSLDAGATWAPAQTVAGPMSLSWIAQSSQGRMVGDYISTAFVNGNIAIPVISWAKHPEGTTSCSTSGAPCRQRSAIARFNVTAPITSDRARAEKETSAQRRRARLSRSHKRLFTAN